MAKLAEVSKRTIDYYTQLGLLQVERSNTNYRFYSEDSLERLKLIEIFKLEKLSLEEIKQRLDALNSPAIESKEVSLRLHRMQEKMKELEEDVMTLLPMLNKLNEKQLKTLTKQITLQGTSLYQTICILLGEPPI